MTNREWLNGLTNKELATYIYAECVVAGAHPEWSVALIEKWLTEKRKTKTHFIFAKIL